MKISVLTLFPDLYAPFIQTSLIRKAQEQQRVTFDIANLLNFCAPKERIDAPIFGHGAGMLLKPEVVETAVDAQEEKHGKAFKIFFSPSGRKLDQDLLKKLIDKLKHTNHLMLLPARYEGMDTRVEKYYADEIVSVGDFVIMGGDLPAMILLEGLFRLIPGVVGKKESVEEDSFFGPFVDHPHYTAPVVWKGLEVPEVLRSGNHKLIAAWREQAALEKSVFEHFDWLRAHETTIEQDKKIIQTIPAHYAVLMHDQVLLPGETGTKEGMTSVTSLDIHDIARSAKSYGIKGYYLVTPLIDQQKIVKKLLNFWQEGVGVTYNPHRHEALREVQVVDSLEAAIANIIAREGKQPLTITTSAKQVKHAQEITFYDQAQVWAYKRPVMLIFGTGRGLAHQLIEKADFNLIPLQGYSEFNHLSVRSAAAVIFDRWLGKSEKQIKA